MEHQPNLRERKTYQTKQRNAVLALFQQQEDCCFTVEEAYLQLAAKGLAVGKTTVYRAITRLCREGVLRRYVDQGQVARFQYHVCAGNHLHVRCVDCGYLAHLTCQEVNAFCSHIAGHHGFQLEENQTVLYGHCARCMSHQGEEAGGGPTGKKQECDRG